MTIKKDIKPICTMYKEIVQFIQKQFNSDGFIPLHAPLFVGREREYVLDSIDSTFVSSVGKYVNRFEQQLCDFTGAKYAVAVVNGTSALHLALQICGVQHGDLVITQPLSFIATCNAISYLGAEPLFIDVDRNTMGLSPEKLLYFLQTETKYSSGVCCHKATGKRITACVPMHTLGHPARIDDLAAVCTQYNIALIEDSAESLGSAFKGRQTGTFGLMGTYSFNGNKTITAGGGGAIVTDNEALALKAKHLSTQAKLSHAWAFQHDAVGYNYRMPNLNAALLCAQMEQLPKFIENQRQLAETYKGFFNGLENVKFVSEPVNCQSNYWLQAILLDSKEDRDAFLAYTNENGVTTRPFWELMYRLPMFKDCIKTDVSNAEYLADRLVNIPSSVRADLL